MTHLNKPKLYIEDEKYVHERIRLSDSAYADAIQALIVVCTDVVIIDREAKVIYLAERASRPMRGVWWYIGGRSMVGETEQDSIHRCFLRETGLDIAKERFEFVCMNRYFFKDRQQEPQTIGCDSLVYTFCIELSQDEREQIILDADEYMNGGGLRAFTQADLFGNPEIKQQFRDIYEMLFT